jgi:cell wall-associated NlpC family hydrolase
MSATWSDYGGGEYAAEAQLATKDQQITVAERVLADQGRGAWPVCGGPLSATPRNTPAEAPAPVDTPPDSPEVNGVVSTPFDAPPPEATPDPPQPPAQVEASDVTATPPPEQAIFVDTAPQPLQPADPPIAVPEPGGPDVDPAADDQQDSAALQTTALSAPPDPALSPPFPPAPSPDAQVDVVDDSAEEVALMSLIHQYSGTPYISGGDTPAGTDCSGLASWLANMASGRPIFGDRFNTSSEESALLARGFQYGTAPGALVIGWNNHHTAVTLADGTPVSSGEGGGIRIGGQGAYQAQFTHHMFLPAAPALMEAGPAPVDAPAAIQVVNGVVPGSVPPPDAVDGGDREAI